MPNLTLHYSPNLEGAGADRVLAAVNAAASESGLFDEADIKTRAAAYDAWKVGTQDAPRGFLHLEVAMSARPQGVEKALSQSLADALQRTVSIPPGVTVQLCVEILHVETATYVKRVLGL
jgi:5-carboxymethyl-2-hydroxymuconate isomerase